MRNQSKPVWPSTFPQLMGGGNFARLGNSRDYRALRAKVSARKSGSRVGPPVPHTQYRVVWYLDGRQQRGWYPLFDTASFGTFFYVLHPCKTKQQTVRTADRGPTLVVRLTHRSYRLLTFANRVFPVYICLLIAEGLSTTDTGARPNPMASLSRTVWARLFCWNL